MRAVLALAVGPAMASAAPAPPVGDTRLWLGVASYPEQWPESRRDAALAFIERAVATVVQVPHALRITAAR